MYNTPNPQSVNTLLQAKRYRDRGLAICRILPGEKRPLKKGWTLRSAEPEDFREGDSIGIQAGRLSGELAIVDLDDRRAVELADRFLPHTGMEEGRAGKPRSHRYYQVKNIVVESPPTCSGGIGGPATLHFDRGPKRVIDFLGTGAQAVAPCSWWEKDGRRELREWHSFEEPAVIDQAELLEAVAALASECGAKATRWENFIRGGAVKEQTTVLANASPAPDLLPFSDSDAVRQARSYFRPIPGAVSREYGGGGGDAMCFRLALKLVKGFVLSVEDALPVLTEWNQRCVPPWSVAELRDKLKCAALKDGPVGWLLNRTPSRKPSTRRITVQVPSEQEEVFVGIGTADLGKSAYVDIKPDLWAALRFVKGERPQLAPELAAVAWKSKDVFVAVQSNYKTNSQVVQNAFRLTSLLRMKGAARVRLMVPTSPDERIVTVAASTKVEVRWPPMTQEEAHNERLMASSRAASQPRRRRRRANAIDEARSWIITNGIKKATADVVERARKEGIREKSIRRALTALHKEDSTHSSKSKDTPLQPSYEMGTLSEQESPLMESALSTSIERPHGRCRQGKVYQAKKWLAERGLRSAPKDVIEQAQRDGIHPKTLRKAVTALRAAA
jgi:hypothetical protein